MADPGDHVSGNDESEGLDGNEVVDEPAPGGSDSLDDLAAFLMHRTADPGVTDEQRYDPDTNPGGARCTLADDEINVLGPRTPDQWGPQEQALGHGFAGLHTLEEGFERFYGRKAARLHPLTVPKVMVSAPVSAIAMEFGVKGPVFGVIARKYWFMASGSRENCTPSK